MNDAEAITQGFLLEVPEAGVGYVVQRPVREELQQRLVVHRHNQVLTAQHKVACLVQGIHDCKSLALYWCVSGLCSMCESAADQGHLPTICATEGSDWCASAVLLKQPESNAVL